MKNKIVYLPEMVKLYHNEQLSELYVRYFCGLEQSHQYRHQEILDIRKLIEKLCVSNEKLEGFIYGYSIPQLNKEFDLLKITETFCLNIELKSGEVSEDRIKKQLLQNIHYLNVLNKEKICAYTYVSSTDSLYTLDCENRLVKTSFSILSDTVNSLSKAEEIDLNSVFTPKNILVSPLNSTEKFLEGKYLLTEHQENIKKDILSAISQNTEGQFIGLTGGPGTGKTLLIYDIVKELSKEKRVLVIHSGILCDGHRELNKHIRNMKIISAKELRYREIKDVDLVVVDESQRLYKKSLDDAERWVIKSKAICLFSYDSGQILSKTEKRRNTSERIDNLCKDKKYELTNKIRTNKELALFITCLRDLSKYRSEYYFPSVKILFEPNKNKALSYAKRLKMNGYEYISYTPSIFNSRLDYQVSENNTHRVIGQEFEGVCMMLGDDLYYEDKKLKGKTHPNPDYLFDQLLYQGLTRVRSKLVLIISSEDLLFNILPMFQK